MGIINQLRQRLGIVLVIFVGISLVAFLAGDFLGQGQLFGGGQNRYVGEIDGEKIDYDRYYQLVEQLRNNYLQQYGTPPNETYMFTIRQQAWDYMVVNVAFKNQYEEIGIAVPEEEQFDMVQGDNIHPLVVQAFTDPNTGQFDRNYVIQLLQQVSQDPQASAQFANFERQIFDARIREKFDNLINKSVYVNKLEAERAYVEANKIIEARFLNVPYVTVPDSAISFTEKDIRDYYQEHAGEYETEAQRTIRYIAVTLEPSAADSAAFAKELQSMSEGFRNAENDSLFARLNSEAADFFGRYNRGEIPAQLEDETLEAGEVYGPFINGYNYSYFKVSESYRDTVPSARASHILLRNTGDPVTDDSLRREASSILRRARSGEDFEELAREYSDDSSAPSGGDLGWFTTGVMVDPFNDAVFGRTSPGIVNEVVESQFGYHIINVTEAPTYQSYAIAKITLELYPSDNTRDAAFRSAGKFAASVDNFDDFQQEAEAQGFQVQVAGAISPTAREVRGLAGSREIVRWAYNTKNVGTISEVFELDDAYVVAVLTEIVEKGQTPLEEIRPVIETAVKNELKGEIIVEKLKGLSGANVDEIAIAYGEEATVSTDPSLSLTKAGIPGIGAAPKAIGAAFSMNEGEVSDPIADQGGVIIVQVDAITEAVALESYDNFKSSRSSQLQSTASTRAAQLIRKKADIKDERYKFL